MIGAKRQYEERIRELVEPAIEAEGMELILPECLMMEGRWIIRLYIDKPAGVTVDDCSTVSYLVGDILDVHDVLPASYTLEVSSPGLNRLLARDKDFLTYRGRNVTVKTDVKIDGVRNFKGVLTDYVDQAGKKVLIVEVRGKSYCVPREAVVSAHLDFDFK